MKQQSVLKVSHVYTTCAVSSHTLQSKLITALYKSRSKRDNNNKTIPEVVKESLLSIFTKTKQEEVVLFDIHSEQKVCGELWFNLPRSTCCLTSKEVFAKDARDKQRTETLAGTQCVAWSVGKCSQKIIARMYVRKL